jgi:hypothetical protein
VGLTAGLAAEQAATGQFSTAAATIRIGLANVEKVPSDGSHDTLFLLPSPPFVKKLKKVKHVMIEAEFYQ